MKHLLITVGAANVALAAAAPEMLEMIRDLRNEAAQEYEDASGFIDDDYRIEAAQTTMSLIDKLLIKVRA